MLDESYFMLIGWTELDRRFAEFYRLVEQGGSMHYYGHATGEIEHVVEWMKNCLSHKTEEAYPSAPNVRELMRRGQDPNDNDWVTPKSRFTDDQDRLLRLLESFREPETKLQ